MRPIHLLLGFVVVLACGASAYVGTRMAESPSNRLDDPTLSYAESQKVSEDPALERARKDSRDQIAMLNARLDAMTMELESLRSAANRAPVAVPVAAESAPEAASSVVITEKDRATVLAVLAEDRARREAEAEAKRIAAEVEAAQRRAGRVAKELSLSPGDEARLADLMVAGNRKRDEMFSTMRGGNFDRETARTQFEGFRTWQSEQYTQAFGASVAEQILQTEGDRMGWGGPGGGQGGQGGANGIRMGRRAGGGAGTPGGGTQQD